MFSKLLHHTFYSRPIKKLGELYIVRHVKSEHNELNCCAGRYNSKPTKEGLEQARQASKLLSKMNIKFDTLYSSPLQRAVMTAEIFSNDLSSIKITTVDALMERNFGAFTGMSKNKIKEILSTEAFNRYMHDKNFFPPDINEHHKYFQSEALYGALVNKHKGESYQCLINRLHPFCEQISIELSQGKNILIVGHSHNLQILEMLLRRETFEQGIEKYKSDHVTPIQFKFSLTANGSLIVKERINLMELTHEYREEVSLLPYVSA